MSDYKVEEIMYAILKINPNAKFNVAGNIDGIEWTNGTTPVSKSDIETQLPIVRQENAQSVQNKITKKASGKAKLKDLGLDDYEIQALIGV